MALPVAGSPGLPETLNDVHVGWGELGRLLVAAVLGLRCRPPVTCPTQKSHYTVMEEPLCSISASPLASSGLQTIEARWPMWLSASGGPGTFSLWQYLQIRVRPGRPLNSTRRHTRVHIPLRCPTCFLGGPSCPLSSSVIEVDFPWLVERTFFFVVVVHKRETVIFILQMPARD